MSDTSFTVAEFTTAIEQSVNTVFMEFNDAAGRNPDALFVFYEGYDNDYYYTRIRQHTHRQIEPINCRNKDKVKKVYQFIVSKPEYDNYHKGYFIDKDFDLNTEPFLDDFYVTSGYSIENLYVSDSCMHSFLTQKYAFHTGDELLEQLMSGFRQMRQKYFDAIVLFNTWYCAIKRKYGNTIRGINLDQKMPSDFIGWDFSTNNVTKNYTMQDIDSKYDTVTYSVTTEELESAETYIKSNLQKNLRGKYCTSFMVRYISDLQGFIKNTPALSRHHRALTISYDNILSILAPYADTEQELLDYINRIAA